MREIERRLIKLETVTAPAPADCAIVIYDAATGLPLAPIPATATYTIWIPENKRGDYERNQ